MRRILVVQTAFLGDIVLTTPLLAEIKRVQPEVSLTVLTTPLGRAVLDGHPSVDAVIAYDKKGSERGSLGLLRVAAINDRTHAGIPGLNRVNRLSTSTRSPNDFGLGEASGKEECIHGNLVLLAVSLFIRLPFSSRYAYGIKTSDSARL